MKQMSVKEIIASGTQFGDKTQAVVKELQRDQFIKSIEITGDGDLILVNGLLSYFDLRDLFKAADEDNGRIEIPMQDEDS